MKSSCFHCDGCGAMAEGDQDNLSPVARSEGEQTSWMYLAIHPYGRPSPIGMPSVIKDFCSAKCAAAFLRASADRLEQLANGG